MINMDKYEKLSMECDASEILRIFSNTPIEFVSYDLVSEVFNKAMKKYSNFGATCVPVSLSAVYLMGYIHGIRAERKKRADKKSNTIKMIEQLSSKNLSRLEDFARGLLKSQMHQC